MAKSSDVLSALFLDIYCQGAIIIDKRKLLGLMGKGQDRPSAWEHLLDLWEEAGYDRSTLSGAEYDKNVILCWENTFEKVTNWADE